MIRNDKESAMENVKYIDCQNINELIKNILNLPKNIIVNWIYRGESSVKYSLLPSILRKEGREKLYTLINSRADEEVKEGLYIELFDALKFFYVSANRQGLYIPNHSHLQIQHNILPVLYTSDFIQNKKINPAYYELIALAQHYNIPTPFLDWTNDFHVAFFFAFRSSIYKLYEKLCCDSFSDAVSDKITIWALDRGNLQSKYKDIFLRFITPRYANNPNLAAQKGTFSYHNIDIDSHSKKENTQNLPLDIYLKNIETKFDNPVLYKFTLPYNEVIDGFVYLQKIGYTYSKIFPGYASISTEMEDGTLLRRINEHLDRTKSLENTPSNDNIGESVR